MRQRFFSVFSFDLGAGIPPKICYQEPAIGVLVEDDPGYMPDTTNQTESLHRKDQSNAVFVKRNQPNLSLHPPTKYC